MTDGRIRVQQGRFVDASGRPFRPAGYHYIRLADNGGIITFTPTLYDSARCERMLDQLAADGYTVVRVFAGAGTQGCAPDGVLQDAYWANVLDLSRRCKAHGIRLLPVWDYLPVGGAYTQGLEMSTHIAGNNLCLMDPAWLEAKSRFLTDVLRRAADAQILGWWLAVEFENEAFFDVSKPPFTLSDTVSIHGRLFRMDREPDRQHAMDYAVQQASSMLSGAVHAVDPSLLTAYSVFTWRAVMRSGPFRSQWDVTPDPRMPVRPVALATADLSYVDIHMYGPAPDAFRTDLRCSEWGRLFRSMRQHGKPLICGEFGTFPAVHPTVGDAAHAMSWYIPELLHAGFEGLIFWTYDCAEQSDVWNARAGSGEIYRAVTRALKMPPRS